MSFQPDMILQLAHHIGEEMKNEGHDVEVRADSRVSMNGNENQVYVNPEIDLMQVKDGFRARNWIMPYEN